MPAPHHDVSRHQPADSNDATVLPFPRKPGEPNRSSTREHRQGQWRVVAIDTEPMTAQHYDQAVTTLAALITRWKHNNRTDAGETHEKAA